MPETCTNCGAELFTGARFCRYCGAQLAPMLTEELPTKVMTGGSATADTAPVGSQTNQVFTAPPAYYPPAPIYPQAPPRTRSPWGWILTFMGIGLLGILLFAALFIARSHRGPGPPPPPPPPGVPGGVPGGLARVEPRRFNLDADASITIKNLNGDVTIVGWDLPQAEVTTTKPGGSDRDQRDALVEVSPDGDSLSVTAGRPGFGGGAVVNLSLKVPREFEHLSVALNNGSLSLSKFNTEIQATLNNGSLSADDISGSTIVKIGNGSASVHFRELADDAPLEFAVDKGNVRLRFDSLTDADLDAKAGMGNISIAPEFGIKPERHMFTERASGRIGEGGRPVKITVGMGNIDIAKD